MLAHIHIMKTAGQTVCDILRNSLSPNHCDLRVGDLATANDIEFAKRVYPNLLSIAGHSVRPRGDLLHVPGIRFFVFLRDPVARCVSHYQFERNRNRRKIEFLSWLERNGNYQVRILSGSNDPQQAIAVLDQHVGFVGLVEDFERSLRLLRNWSGFELELEYRSRNIARDQSIKSQLLSNPEFAQALREANAGDLLLYRHAANKVFPKLEAEYSQSSGNLISFEQAAAMWGRAKRNLVYKPLAKTRQRFRRAA